MKIVQVIPKPDVEQSLKTQLTNKERQLRGGATAFARQKGGRWKHVKYSGWIIWEGTKAGILIAKVQTKKEGSDWQLLQAFIGYLDRHLGSSIESITVIYR